MQIRNLFNPPKKVVGSLVGVNGNAFALMAYFDKLARRQGWRQQEIEMLMKQVITYDYNHLVALLNEHMKGEPDAE